MALRSLLSRSPTLQSPSAPSWWTSPRTWTASPRASGTRTTTSSDRAPTTSPSPRRFLPRNSPRSKQALGPQFQTFVQYDKRVHRTATELVEAAQARNWSAVLDTHERLERGCVSCHTAYRDTVRAVLRP